MKKLFIKTYEGNTTTLTLLNDCLNARPANGYGKNDIIQRVSLSRKMKEAEEKNTKELAFEDDEALRLKALVSEIRWGRWGEDILNFIEEVDKL
jgi:hypothetical protein